LADLLFPPRRSSGLEAIFKNLIKVKSGYYSLRESAVAIALKWKKAAAGASFWYY